MEIELRQTTLSQSRKAYFARQLKDKKRKIDFLPLQQLNDFSSNTISISLALQNYLTSIALNEQKIRTEYSEPKTPYSAVSGANP
jgi:hypothetical protein